MVTTGFSRIHVAKYTNAGGAVTYSDVRELARARNMDSDISVSDENNFYANNEVAEAETAVFESGTVNIGVDGLSAEEEAFILGIEESTVSVNGEDVPVIAFGESMDPPYLGIGAVKRMKFNGVTSFRPVIFTKARFAIPSDAAETGEKSINWQDQSLSATLMRDDTPKHNWKIIPKANFSTEEEAVAFIVAVLGGKAAQAANVGA